MASQELSKATYEETVSLVSQNIDIFFENDNWDHVAVIPVGETFQLSVQVYDFRQELNKTRQKALPYFTYNEQVRGDILTYEISFSDFAISAISGSQKNITEIIEKNILVVIDELRNSTPIVHKKARCNRLRPRMMGHKLINKFTNGNVGSLGGIVKGKCGNLHILTAYHVVKNNNEIMYSDVGQPIISPPDSRDYRKDTIGRLSWYSESLDIAFIEVDPNHQHRITGGSICCDIVDDNLGVVTSTGGTVKICSSWQKGTIKGKIKSTYCAKRLTKGNSQVLKNLVQTENMAVPGDSGSLVIDDSTDKVVGMMVSDNSTECSYFTKLDILKSRIYKKIKVRNTEHIFDFTFKKFVN